MKKSFLIAAVLTLSVLLSSCAAASPPAVQSLTVVPSHTVSRQNSSPADYLPCPEYDSALVYEQLTRYAEASADTDGKLLGATMPHYAPMMQLGIPFLRSIAEARSVETVVILAPNHAGSDAPFIISGRGYTWDSGCIDGCPEAADLLISCVPAESHENIELLSEEYSASVWAPYIADIFPDADVVTVLLNRGASADGLSALAAGISALAESREIFVLASIDFSHYQTPEIMADRDEITRETISGGSMSALRKLDGTYLDCPEAVCILSKLTWHGGAVTLSELDYETLVYSENGKRLGASYFIYGVS